MDVVVVGGGLGGLCCAAMVGRAGRSVICFERSSELGGRGRTLEDSGFAANLGPHALYRRGPARDALDALGVEVVGRTPEVDSTFLVGEVHHTLPRTPRELLTSSALDLRGRLGLMRVFARLPRLDPSQVEAGSTEDWIRRQPGGATLHRLLRSLFTLTTYSARLEDLDASAGLTQLRAALDGVLYVDGGWGALVASVASTAEAAGVGLRAGLGIRQVARGAGGGWRVEADDGEVWTCASLVLAVPPRQVERLVGDQPEWAAVQGPRGDARPVRAACLELGLRGAWRGPGFVLASDPPGYLSVHSLTAKGLAPDDGCALSVLAYLREQDEALDAEQLRARVEGLLARFAPRWRERVAFERFMPKLVVAHDFPESGRPSILATLGPDLHLVGDWVASPHSRGGQHLLLDASLASASRACGLITREGPRRLEHVGGLG